MPLLAALLAAPVLKKIPQPARDDYQDLILTLQNMAEALGGTEISAGEDIRKKDLDEKPAPENPHGELFEFFADAPAETRARRRPPFPPRKSSRRRRKSSASASKAGTAIF